MTTITVVASIGVCVIIALAIWYFYYRPSHNSKEITLLLIGPPSSGKTALIYFMYRFAQSYLTGKKSGKKQPVETKKAAEAEDGESANQPGSIKEIQLKDFIVEVTRELANSRDFVGTRTGTIDFINHDTGKVKLKIFNISGEIFGNTDTHGEKLTDLAMYLDQAEIDNVYCLLVDEIKSDTDKGDGGDTLNINWDSVRSYFSGNERAKSSDIFDNVNKGKNTLRIVTKFDKVYVPEKPPHKYHKRIKDFLIYTRALNELNKDEFNFLENHRISYETPELDFFNGSNQRQLCGKFVCTGLFDKEKFTCDLYEPAPEVSEPGKAGYILKERYYKNNGLKYLEMYGIAEIFVSILWDHKIRKKTKELQPIEIPRNTDAPISGSDYKRILGIER